MRDEFFYLDASLEHVEAVDCSFESQVPWMDSSCFAAAGSALDDLDNAVVAYIDWDHFALHDVDEAAHDSSFHFDTLFKHKQYFVTTLRFHEEILHKLNYHLEECHQMDLMQQLYHQMC